MVSRMPVAFFAAKPLDNACLRKSAIRALFRGDWIGGRHAAARRFRGIHLLWVPFRPTVVVHPLGGLPGSHLQAHHAMLARIELASSAAVAWEDPRLQFRAGGALGKLSGPYGLVLVRRGVRSPWLWLLRLLQKPHTARNGLVCFRSCILTLRAMVSRMPVAFFAAKPLDNACLRKSTIRALFRGDWIGGRQAAARRFHGFVVLWVPFRPTVVVHPLKGVLGSHLQVHRLRILRLLRNSPTLRIGLRFLPTYHSTFRSMISGILVAFFAAKPFDDSRLCKSAIGALLGREIIVRLCGSAGGLWQATGFVLPFPPHTIVFDDPGWLESALEAFPSDRFRAILRLWDKVVLRHTRKPML